MYIDLNAFTLKEIELDTFMTIMQNPSCFNRNDPINF